MLSSLKKINFFIVGGPRAGTDSMREWLSGCDDVFVYGPREPNYFCSDVLAQPKSSFFWTNRIVLAGLRHRLIGEKSTWYLALKDAPRRIKNYNPNARILVLTREHFDLFKSLHGELVKLGVEKTLDPLQAWSEAQTSVDRLTFANQIIGNYPESCLTGAQLQNWITEFGHEQVFVLQIGNVKERRWREAVAKFLGIETFPEEDAPKLESRKASIVKDLERGETAKLEASIADHFQEEAQILNQLRTIMDCSERKPVVPT